MHKGGQLACPIVERGITEERLWLRVATQAERGYSSVVERLLCMQKVLGSMPSISSFFPPFLNHWICLP